MIKLRFQHTYADELPGFSVPQNPETVAKPSTLFWNRELAGSLGLAVTEMDEETVAAMFSGNQPPEDSRCIAQAYAGHQFGHFSPQLGDGRAVLLGEILDPAGNRFDIALKGSGRTAFSRGGDGKAAVGPMLREVLVGEFLHAVGIPTTRALAVVGTGEIVRREVALPGAVLTRVAASHIRVGTFEFFAARDDQERVRRLADYAIARHTPDLAGADDRFQKFLAEVSRRQAQLVAKWMSVGFVHGVMNTDNMAVSGESIDFGPCAFLEAYHPDTVFSSIDRHGRYAYRNQPAIARWNLARLCESFLPLLAPDPKRAIELATEIVDSFPGFHKAFLLDEWRAKLGLAGKPATDDAADAALADDWLALLQAGQADFTQSWRCLAAAAEGNEGPLRSLLQGVEIETWLLRWRSRCGAEDPRGPVAAELAKAVRGANPLVVPRNHLVEEALASATESGKLEPFDRLLEALRRPCETPVGFERFLDPAPVEVAAAYRTFCGT
jgi:serine/tyrosine/threonine adenylyltransferase